MLKMERRAMLGDLLVFLDGEPIIAEGLMIVTGLIGGKQAGPVRSN
jgi:hypothetical protein